MDKTSGIAALTAVLAVCAGLAVAQTETVSPALSQDYGREEAVQPETRPATYDEPSRVDQDVSIRDEEKRREKKRRLHSTEAPDRMEPWRVFPGDLPVKTTTSGSLDREGRVLNDNRTNSAPPTNDEGAIDPGSTNDKMDR